MLYVKSILPSLDQFAPLMNKTLFQKKVKNTKKLCFKYFLYLCCSQWTLAIITVVLWCVSVQLCNSSPTIVTRSPQTRVRIGLQAAGATALPPPAWAAEMAFPMSHRETAEWPARSDKTKNKHVTALLQTIKCNATEEEALIFHYYYYCNNL